MTAPKVRIVPPARVAVARIATGLIPRKPTN